MERLTMTNQTTGKAYLIDVDDDDVQDAIQKLAKYEDLEEQGMLVRLPCKVGDKAYYVRRHTIDEVEVDSFMVRVLLKLGNMILHHTLTPYKDLFFTKEAAEAALKEINKNKGE